MKNIQDKTTKTAVSQPDNWEDMSEQAQDAWMRETASAQPENVQTWEQASEGIVDDKEAYANWVKCGGNPDARFAKRKASAPETREDKQREEGLAASAADENEQLRAHVERLAKALRDLISEVKHYKSTGNKQFLGAAIEDSEAALAQSKAGQ